MIIFTVVALTVISSGFEGKKGDRLYNGTDFYLQGGTISSDQISAMMLLYKSVFSPGLYTIVNHGQI